MTAALLRDLRLYRRCLGAVIRGIMEYVADFWILIGAGIVTQSLGLVFLGVVFAKVPTLAGWTFPEMVLIYSLFGIVAGVLPIFADGIWNLGRLIHEGRFDYLLTRPYSPLLQVLSRSMGFNGVGDTLASLAMFGWAVAHVDVAWTPGTVLVGLVLLASAIALRLALLVIGNSAAFWVRSPFVFAITVLRVGELGRYPIGIYGLGIRLLLTTALPFAFTAFYPAAWLLGRGGQAWLGLGTPLVAALAWLAALKIFNLGLRRYESSGH
ncbi:multidrug ABC transporter permease [Sphaerisporangium rufum]|uniref:Multidrug ABC transporter permease n=1 Tax=Sphaerisporangium rufum TaxID=1381558 RepID=A0A919R5M2_9ACTN|nr:ABC-2 family transporter protein [Sphaerisporangium rufum]GII80094.1 multidrug ABC transporter permease [Sphaerisporangium rufum]